MELMQPQKLNDSFVTVQSFLNILSKIIGVYLFFVFSGAFSEEYWNGRKRYSGALNHKNHN